MLISNGEPTVQICNKTIGQFSKHFKEDLALEQYNPKHQKNSVCSTKLETDKWHDIVLHIHLSRDKHKGFVEFWYNGKQKLEGLEKFICRTLDAEHCDPKWGIYGGDAADATAFFAQLKCYISCLNFYL